MCRCVCVYPLLLCPIYQIGIFINHKEFSFLWIIFYWNFFFFKVLLCRILPSPADTWLHLIIMNYLLLSFGFYLGVSKIIMTGPSTLSFFLTVMGGFTKLIFTVYVSDNKELKWIELKRPCRTFCFLYCFFWFSSILGTVALWLFYWIHSVVPKTNVSSVQSSSQTRQ